ncbi:MAG TPA: FtsW/RodA/SpoVE family cell cycle protein, partial [Synergistales bacterium]|nr:FtsW/RodA/SpoVE family cell cycle protein [Synergistales bacterium]
MRTAPSLWLIPLSLSLFGLLSIVSISSRLSLGGDGSIYALAYRQGMWLIFGLAGMLIASVIPISLWKRLSGIIWLLALLLTFATLSDLIGVEAGGARRWIRIGSVRFQP